MANSSSSVSYLQVYQNWIKNDRDRNNGQSTIPITDITTNLRLDTMLMKPEHQTVNGKETDNNKLIKLFHEYMPGKGEEGFKLVVDYLNQNKYIGLANDLVTCRKQLILSNKIITVCLDYLQPSIIHFLDDGVTPVQNQTAVDVHQTTSTISKPLTEAQEHLSKFIKLNVDSMADFWSGQLHLPSTWSAFVDVQILEDFKDDKGKPVYKYKEVFGNVSEFSFNRILIQGDPGCGKSTYANKIALDWANKNEYLREKFDLVFLIPLQMLSSNIEQAIRTLLPQRSDKFAEYYDYTHHSSKVLLLLDGFDEFPEDSEFYTEVMRMLNAKLTQFQFFTIVITTRSSHVDKVPQRYHGRSLLIKGFNEQSMKQFLQIQQVPVPDEQTDSNLIVLLQNPLFCTIYCSLHFFGVDKSKLKDPFDFIKDLVVNVVKIEKNKKEITNEEDQLKLLGAFAFQKLNKKTLNVLDKIFYQKKSPQHVETIDMDQIQLGLLIKKKILSVGGEYKQEFGFPHQMIAEYLAATYFVHHCLTKSQLEQLRPDILKYWARSVLLHELILSSPSSLPFIRFLLFECVSSHLSDKEQRTGIILHILSKEFRFSCYSKSNSETPTINDITSLNCWNIDSDIRHDSCFFATLAKCINLKSLDLASCELSTNEVNKLGKLFKENCLLKLIELDLCNTNVGSAPNFFTALGNCKRLERLVLNWCNLSNESINRLATCIDSNCWENLRELDLSRNTNVGSTPDFFTALGKCKLLKRLDLDYCDLPIGSINQLITCIENNSWPNLERLDLYGNKNAGSANELFHVSHKCLHIRHLDASLKVENSLMAEAQEHLSKFIIHNVDARAEFWSGRLHLPSKWSGFVDVQVLKNFKDDKGKPVHEYKEVFECVSVFSLRLILIQGDPGCGKSTYVSKIALDWANNNEYLREKFDLVFLIPLQTLSSNIEQAISALLPERSIKFVEKYYKGHSSKVLLILDGFDEFPEDSEFYTEVTRMLDAKLTQFQFFTIVITTRSSHVDKVPHRYHGRSLLIKGFNEQSMKQFLQIQQVPVPAGPS